MAAPMICPECRGRGFFTIEETEYAYPCETCAGSGVASCCDAAGSLIPGAERVKLDPYRDGRFAPRECDFCGVSYQGPAVYCSYACAIDDA